MPAQLCSPAHRGQSRLLPPASRQRGSVARARAFPATSCLPTIPWTRGRLSRVVPIPLTPSLTLPLPWPSPPPPIARPRARSGAAMAATHRPRGHQPPLALPPTPEAPKKPPRPPNRATGRREALHRRQPSSSTSGSDGPLRSICGLSVSPATPSCSPSPL